MTPTLVTTFAATLITDHTASLNGNVNPEGVAATVSFEYGLDPSLASGTTTTPPQSVGSGTTNVTVSTPITGLDFGTPYYGRVVATSAGCDVRGAIVRFNTSGVGVPHNSVPGPQTVGVDRTLAFAAAYGNLLQVADLPAETKGLQVVVDVVVGPFGAPHGVVSVPTIAGVTITGNGTASLRLTGLVGDINAGLSGLVYRPDSGYTGSDFLHVTTNDQGATATGSVITDTDQVEITVVGGQQIATSTVLSASPEMSQFGQPVTLTATVTAASGAALPLGLVTFVIDGTPQIPVPVQDICGQGQAAFVTSTLPVGPHSVTASFSGNSTMATSPDSKVVALTVNPPSTLVVTTDADTIDGGTLADPIGLDGLLSLREAITVANLRPGSDDISFNIPGGGVRTINVGGTGFGALPAITEAVTIEGYSQPEASLNTLAVGDNAAIRVVLNGANAGPLANGITIRASDTIIRGLSLGEFLNYGIAIESGDNNRIVGNFVGVDATGFAPHGNQMGGIFVQTAHNFIGGADPADRNVISSNGSLSPYGVGLYFFSPEAFDNRVFGNYIGPAADGVTGLGNFGYGIVVDGSGSFGNYLGDVNPGEGNVISWNGVDTFGGGILLLDTSGNLVRGNLIGTTAAGTGRLGNDGVGVRVLFGGGNTIGGTTPAARNVIADTTGDGIQLQFTTNNTIQGNYIGTNASGFTDLSGPGPNTFGNGGHGIAVYGSANNLIGGATTGAGNLISGNKDDGIRFGTFNNDGQVVGSTGNMVQGNLIGTSTDGTAGMGNGRDGIFVSNSSNNTIGGTTPETRNVISGNGNNGIGVSGGTISPDGNVIQGNYIGTNAAGTAAIGNRSVGIGISGATNTLIGGTVAGVGNVISGNGVGIALGASGAVEGTVIQGNRIGTYANGTAAIGNFVGIGIAHSSGNTIGGTGPGTGNVISGNALAGVVIVSAGASTTGNKLLGNWIGTDAGGLVGPGNGGADPVPLTPLLNLSLQSFNPALPALTTDQVAALDGGVVVWGASGNTIGGTDPGAGNVIAYTRKAVGSYATSGNGVTINDGTGNRISGNSIFANEGLGIDLFDNGNNNQPAPTISSATTSKANGSTTVVGTIAAAVSTTYTLEFFGNPVGGTPEGKSFIGTGSVTTNGAGFGTFTVTLPTAVPTSLLDVTATATDPVNNTSPFSAPPPAAGVAPAFTSAAVWTVIAGTPGTFTIRTSGTPTAVVTLVGGTLPSGLTFAVNGDGTATLSGTPAAGTGGVFTLMVQAANGVLPNASQTFVLTVKRAPAITSGTGATFTVGAAGTFTVTATGFPAPALTLVGELPAGLTFDAATGVLSGIPAAGAAGTYTFTVTAANGVAPDASQLLSLTVNPAGVAVPYAIGSGPGMAATVRLLNDGKDLFPAVFPFGPDFTSGVRVASGDVTGDGVTDVIAGNGPGIASAVRVIDGKSGNVLFDLTPFEETFTGGTYVSAGDVNGDGIADLVVTPDLGGGPRVVVYDGKTHAVVANFFAFEPEFRGGATAAVGDVNGDGVPDLMVGAGTSGGPRVAVFDGATLFSGDPARLVSDFFAFEPESRMGVHLSAADLDGDGMAEVVAGPGVGGGPRLVGVSGRSLLAAGDAGPELVVNFFTAASEDRGGVHVAACDVDGDGHAELLTGSGDGTGGRVAVYATVDVLNVAEPLAAWGLDPFGEFDGGVFVG